MLDGSSNLLVLTSVGQARISTVFLCIDHNLTGKGPPVLFETMIFGGWHDQVQWRYSTYEEAEIGHKVAVALEQQASDELDRLRRLVPEG